MTETALSSLPVPDLSFDQAREEVRRLSAALRKHNHLYHVLAEPSISDAAYDQLFRRLQQIEDRFPDLLASDSPTQRVGADPLGSLPSVAHAAPMLSLDSSQEESAVVRFDERLRKALGEDVIEYLLEPKLDGASLELVYENGLFTGAVTRGNGRIGEGVTENARTIPSVPLRLHGDIRKVPEFLSVRGEALMYLQDFETLNQAQIEAGKEPYQNPRNATSGALRQLDSRVTAKRPLTVLVYDILAIRGDVFEKDSDSVQALRDWGFRVPERVEVVQGIQGIKSYHKRYDEERESLDYEIDGIVIKLNEIEPRHELGSTSHHPRWAMAYKFEPRKEITRIDRIFVSVGRTGVLTPVALLRPVEVGGVTVSRASLHNREELARKDVRKGDLVKIQRAGDVIPQVVARVPEEGRERQPPFQMPDTCPSCGAVPEERGPFTVCPNHFACPAQLKGRIVHFASRHALDIEGLGEETAAMFVDLGLVRELADLFELTEEHLVHLEGFATVSARKLISAIEARRTVELARFLTGLGIPEVGVTVARDLSAHFRSVQNVLAASPEQLVEVRGIGPKMSTAIRGFLDEERTREAIQALLAKDFTFLVPEVPSGPAQNGPLAGQTAVITGTLESFTRDELKSHLTSLGARVTGSVSAKTSFVVVGEAAGSKLAKAEKLGVPTLDEAALLALLREHGVEV